MNRIRIALCLTLLVMAVLSAGQQKAPLDGKADASTMKFLKELKRDQVAIFYSDHHRRSPEVSNYEAAVAFHAASENVKEWVREMNDGDADVRTEYRAKLANAFGTIMKLDGAAERYSEHLTSLGVDMPTYLKELREIRARLAAEFLFSDVPAKHWASGAIANLKEIGVLSGYSVGKFRG
jgi:hypothetical protein